MALLFFVFIILSNVHSPKMDEAKRLHLLSSLKKKEILKIEKQKKEVLKSYKLNEVEKRKIDEVLLKLKKEIKLAKTKSEIELTKQKAWFLLNDLKNSPTSSQFYSAVEKLKILLHMTTSQIKVIQKILLQILIQKATIKVEAHLPVQMDKVLHKRVKITRAVLLFQKAKAPRMQAAA